MNVDHNTYAAYMVNNLKFQIICNICDTSDKLSAEFMAHATLADKLAGVMDEYKENHNYVELEKTMVLYNKNKEILQMINNIIFTNISIIESLKKTIK